MELTDMSDEELEFTTVVRVDTNDADYLTEVNAISKSDLDLVLPLIEAIKLKSKEMSGEWFHNYERVNISSPAFDPRKLYTFPDKIFDILDNLCPTNEEGFHSIESIEIAPKVNFIKLI